jgi:hypothetical protein
MATEQETMVESGYEDFPRVFREEKKRSDGSRMLTIVYRDYLKKHRRDND